MRGRRPSGPEYVERLAGSEQAKERLKVVLETLAGTCRVQEACRRLGVSEPRFHQLRTRCWRRRWSGWSRGRRGGPRSRASAEQERLAALEERLAAQDVELRAAQARAEIALALPRRGPRSRPPEKKTRTAATGPEAPAAWQEEAHLRRLEAMCQPTRAGPGASRLRPAASSGARGAVGPARAYRRAAAAGARRWVGHSRGSAELLNCSAANAPATGDIAWRPAGACRLWAGRRHARRSPRAGGARAVRRVGPGVGLPTLRGCFPGLLRAELEDLLRRCRCVWRRTHPGACTCWTGRCRAASGPWTSPRRRPRSTACIRTCWRCATWPAASSCCGCPRRPTTPPRPSHALASLFVRVRAALGAEKR